MDIRQWRTPAIILGILVALYLYTQLGEARHSSSTDAVFDLATDEVGRIVMTTAGQRAELIRSDSLWKMTGYDENPVRQWRLDSFLRSVLGVERESMVSANPDKWGTYGVDDSTGKQVQVYNRGDNLVGHLIVGQSRSNFQSSYIREAGEDEVYLTRQSIFHLLAADSSFWLNAPPAPDTTGVEG